MKKILTSYFILFSFLFGSYFLIALLFALIRSFISISSIYLIISSYILIMLAAFIFIHQNLKRALFHACFIALIYALISYLIGNGVQYWLHFTLKPICFVSCCFLFKLMKKEM